MRRAKHKINKCTLITLYYSLIYPYLIYCNSVWGNAGVTFISKLHRIQKSAVRIIFNLKFREHTEDFFKAANILTVFQLFPYSCCIFMYKCLNNIMPPIICCKFTLNRNHNVHSMSTRNHNVYSLPLCRTSIRYNSVTYQGPMHFNSLDQSLQNSTSIQILKKKLKLFFVYTL